jgi:hypothetical protein
VAHFSFLSLSSASFLCLGLGCAQAADPARAPYAHDGDWKIIVSPYVWATSLNGNASLAGFDGHVDLPFSDVLKHLDFAFMGNIEATNGTFGVYFDGQYARTSQEEEIFANSVGLGTRVTSLGAGMYYRIYEKQLGGNTAFGDPQRFGIEPTIGVRWTRLEAGVEALGLTEPRQADWTDPFVGVRANLDLGEHWNLFGEVDVGGFGVGSKLSVNAQAYLGYRTFVFDHPAILRVGYRALSQDYETDDFTGNKFRWDVVQHGPVVGMSLVF